jgi:hypothetical protein
LSRSFRQSQRPRLKNGRIESFSARSAAHGQMQNQELRDIEQMKVRKSQMIRMAIDAIHAGILRAQQIRSDVLGKKQSNSFE